MAKPRVIISTDIGGADNDDMQSMAHALLASDQWDLRALISTPTGHGGRTSDIHQAIDAYTADYANLKTWSSGYKTPDQLKTITYQGNLGVAPSAGYSSATAASNAIIKAAHEANAAGEPLWVMTWGALTDVAQALHDDPSIASTIRVLASNGWNWKQDPNAYNYVVDTHAGNGLWMIDSKSTHRGIYIDLNGNQVNPFDLNKVKTAGALGDYFYKAMPWGVKMGDSWSIAYLTDQADNNNPWADSWGGQFVKNGKGPNYYTDDPNPAHNIAGYAGAAHVREHQTHIYQDMYKLFARAKAPSPDGSSDSGSTDSGSTGGSSDGGTSSSSAGTGNLVTAVDDNYKVDPGKALWFNARYLTMNDKGADGGLQVVGISATTAFGVKMSLAVDGTVIYRAPIGWQGIDSMTYTVRDADGSTDTAKVYFKVGHGGDPLPSGAGSTGDDSGGSTSGSTGGDTSGITSGSTDGGTSGGSGNPVTAADDQYKVDPGKQLWFNARYLTMNDKGLDGGLKVTGIGDTTAFGVKVSLAADGTIVYRAPSGWQGTDQLTYTVQDADGSSDAATVFIKVGHGGDALPSSGDTTGDDGTSDGSSDSITGGTGSDTGSGTGGGSGNPVTAVDDNYQTAAGKTLWVNAGYFKWNDKGLDGGLKVTGIDSTTAAGVAVSMKSDGTIVYRPLAGWQGTDQLAYTVQDVDGSTDTGTVFVKVGHGGDPLPSSDASTDIGSNGGDSTGGDSTSGGDSDGGSASGTGTGNPVFAIDDNYQTAAGQTLWVNAGSFKRNDNGPDGGLAVTGIGGTTAAGVAVSMKSDGTIAYRPLDGWQGTDQLAYTVRDVDGSTDTGTVFIKVGHGGDPLPGSSDAVADADTPSAGAPKILALGDSHTYGVISTSFDRESGGYRLFLSEKLKDAGLPVDFVGRQESGPSTFDNDHEGYSRIQIDGLTAKVPSMMSVMQPDYILLLAGNNDAIADSVAAMTTQMGQLIDTLSSHAPDAQILVAGILPALPDNLVGMDPAKIAGFNAALPGLVAAKASAGAKVSFVDTSSLGLSDVSGLDVDKGVHLTSAGHQKLAEIWFQALKSAGMAGEGSAATQPSSGDSGDTGSTGSTGSGDNDASAPAGSGTGYPVTASDDQYKIDAGKTLYFNTRYLTPNDQGKDGGLHVTALDSISKAGVKVSWGPEGSAADGTAIYKPLPGWEGVDTINYTLADADGSTDVGTVHIQVGAGDMLLV